MQREILFKAKRKDNNEWVYGWIHRGLVGNTWYLIEEYDSKSIEVIPETICQYTGLADKNGVKIFENDIVYIVYDAEENTYQVVYDMYELDFKATNGEENYESNFQYFGCADEIEVIGNIFDGEVK